MNISWTAISALLVLVTPALPLLVLFRLAFPKTTLQPRTDFAIVLFGCLVGLLMNASLLGSLALYVGAAIFAPGNLVGWEKTVFELFARDAAFSPFRPSLWALHLAGHDIAEFNPLYVLSDLHIRPFLGGCFVWFVIATLSFIERFIQFFPYWDFALDEKMDFCRYYLEREATQTSISHYKRDWLTKRAWLNHRLNFVRASVFHPWAILTQSNRWRELLMIDVLTDEGSLYSGYFTSYVPDGNSISAVSIEYILRYRPTDQEDDVHAELDATKTAPPTAKKRKKQRTEKSLISNNGELIIPVSEIKTVHFWEIRRGFSCRIIVRHESNMEVLKWYLLLASLFQGFFQRISVKWEVKDSEALELSTKLEEWILESKLTFHRTLILEAVD